MEIKLDSEIIKQKKKDNVLANIIDKCTLSIHKSPLSLFDDLLRSIVSQQLSTTAAATIYGRFLALFDDKSASSMQILSKSIEELRSVGLSYQKATYT